MDSVGQVCLGGPDLHQPSTTQREDSQCREIDPGAPVRANWSQCSNYADGEVLEINSGRRVRHRRRSKTH